MKLDLRFSAAYLTLMDSEARTIRRGGDIAAACVALLVRSPVLGQHWPDTRRPHWAGHWAGRFAEHPIADSNQPTLRFLLVAGATHRSHN